MSPVAHLRPLLLLLVLCAVLFGVGLNTHELVRNEGLRALVAVELLRGGHPAVPTLHGQPFLTKPPGMSIAIALASWPAGVSAASARLPSAVAATLTVVLFYFSFARILGRRAGLIAGALLPCSALWLDRAPSAEIDMLQLAWVSASLLFLLRAVESHEEGRGRWREWGWWQAALLCVAGGLLTKWTAPAFFYLSAVPLLAWRGRLSLLVRLPHLCSVAVAVILCLGWAGTVIAEVGWAPLAHTVQGEALQRLSPAHHPRPYPWLELITFPGGFLLACLPGAGAAVLAARRGFAESWDERGRRLLQLLHCWAWPNLLFWTIVPGHRPRHALPLQPALAGLAALVWVGWISGRIGSGALPTLVGQASSLAQPHGQARRLPYGRAFVALVVLWVGVKLTFALWIAPERAHPRQPRAHGEQLAALVPLDRPLYLFRVKDEGILFYFGRPTRRLPGPEHLPTAGRPSYCLLGAEEWQRWPVDRRAEVVGRLTDEQGAGLVLVKAGTLDDEQP
jgi:4-amino-4-deoxy-L-arabinose transferase-like glycosyltransferase